MTVVQNSGLMAKIFFWGFIDFKIAHFTTEKKILSLIAIMIAGSNLGHIVNNFRELTYGLGL